MYASNHKHWMSGCGYGCISHMRSHACQGSDVRKLSHTCSQQHEIRVGPLYTGERPCCCSESLNLCCRQHIPSESSTLHVGRESCKPCCCKSADEGQQSSSAHKVNCAVCPKACCKSVHSVEGCPGCQHFCRIPCICYTLFLGHCCLGCHAVTCDMCSTLSRRACMLCSNCCHDSLSTTENSSYKGNVAENAGNTDQKKGARGHLHDSLQHEQATASVDIMQNQEDVMISEEELLEGILKCGQTSKNISGTHVICQDKETRHEALLDMGEAGISVQTLSSVPDILVPQESLTETEQQSSICLGDFHVTSDKAHQTRQGDRRSSMQYPQIHGGLRPLYDLHAMGATNLLNLALCNPALLRRWAERMVTGVPRGSRDDLDLAGKLPLCLKALQIGIDPKQLGQAGGVYGRNDGCIAKLQAVEPIEVKGGICRKGKKNCYSFNKIRSHGVDWKHLFLVGRLKNPTKWDNLADMDQIMYLGYVEREVYERALCRSGRSVHHPTSVSVSPMSRGSWLGPYVKWVKFSALNKEWWIKNVLK